MLATIEPTIETMQEWASGLVDICECGVVTYQHANWAYVYLGYENPDFNPMERIINQAVVHMTVASRLRLSELGYEW